MIEQNELRRNCYVNWNGEYGKIKAIYEEEVLFYCGEEALFSEIEPIPLTEELLLKCGFVKDGIPTGYTILNKFQLRYCCKDILKNIREWNFEAYNDDNWIGISKPQYLHQLQNLYLSLTSQELEINL